MSKTKAKCNGVNVALNVNQRRLELSGRDRLYTGNIWLCVLYKRCTLNAKT
jgi:hypothetical protein